jgi:hypothetical protein
MSTSVPRAAREYTEWWCEGGEIGDVALSGGARVRYLRVGSGPPMVLMHTVRTQLDHFQFVIPRISDAFTVYEANIETLSGARHIALPDTGHFAALEAPQHVARILLDST